MAAQDPPIRIPRPYIPCAVPGMGLQRLQHAGADLPQLLRVGRFTVGSEVIQHAAKEEPQEYTFPLHAVHAIVPVPAFHQRDMAWPEAQAADGPQAMFHQRGRIGGGRGEVIQVVLSGGNVRAHQEGGGSRQHLHVSGAADVPRGHEGQEKPVIGDPGAHAGMPGVPPVLHVACLVLPGGAEQQMTAHLLRVGVDQRGHVLQLIPEADGPAGLVEAGPRP